MNALQKALDDLVTDERGYREDEDERNHHQSRFPQFTFAGPSDPLRFRTDSGDVFLGLFYDVHFSFPVFGRVGGNRTPIGGFGDRCTAIVLLP